MRCNAQTSTRDRLTAWAEMMSTDNHFGQCILLQIPLRTAHTLWGFLNLVENIQRMLPVIKNTFSKAPLYKRITICSVKKKKKGKEKILVFASVTRENSVIILSQLEFDKTCASRGINHKLTL